jgi:integrase
VYDDQGNRINCPKKHGTWYYAHELPPDGSRRRQVRKGGFRTEKAARAAMNDAIAKVATGTWFEYPRITVAEYLDEWIAGKTTLRLSTFRSYRESITLYLNPGLGHLKLGDLRDVDVEKLYAAMRELGTEEESGEALSPLARRLTAARANSNKVPKLSDARIRRVHATLMSALNTGVKRRRLPANPAQHVELPTGRRPRAVVWTAERVQRWKETGEHPPVAVWTAEQTGVFLDAAASHRLYPIFHLIAYRGLRRGEAIGLRWTDLDLDGGYLTVAQQVLQIGWEIVIGEPKTETGARQVSLDAATVKVLRRWKTRQADEREQCAGAWQEHGLVFTREDGSVLQPDSISDLFHELAETAGLPPIRLHDLRHTAASLALQAGVPLKVVSESLGHSSLAITADTYTSVLPEVAKAAAEAVAGIIPRTPAAEPVEESAAELGEDETASGEPGDA